MSTTPTEAERAKPESLRVREFSASVSVNDLMKSLAWYTDVLGFTVQQKHEREGELVAVSLVAGTARLLIGRDDGKKGWDRVKGDGMSFYFSTTQDIDGVANRVKNAGGTLESEPADMPWGVRAFSVRDPDAFRIVICSVRDA